MAPQAQLGRGLPLARGQYGVHQERSPNCVRADGRGNILLVQAWPKKADNIARLVTAFPQRNEARARLRLVPTRIAQRIARAVAALSLQRTCVLVRRSGLPPLN